MKSKCSFILKASTALVLALLMLFGTVTTSLAAVVDKADTGAEADLAETGAAASFVANSYIYLKNFKPTGWDDPWITSSSYAWIHMWGGTGGDHDYRFELFSGTAGTEGAIYRAKVTDAGTYTTFILTRNNSTTSPWGEWNRIGDVTFSNVATNYISTGTDSSVTQSYYATNPTSANATISNAVSGSGTSSDPYKLTVGTEYTVNISGVHSDPGMTGFYYNDANSSTGRNTTATRQLSSSTASTGNSKTYYVWSYKSSSSYLSATPASKTIYYDWVAADTCTLTLDKTAKQTLNIGETFDLTVSSEHCSGSASSLSIASSSSSYVSATLKSTGTNSRTYTIKALKPTSSDITLTASCSADSDENQPTLKVAVRTPQISLSYSPSSVPATGNSTSSPTASINTSYANSGSSLSNLSYSVTSGSNSGSVNSSTGAFTSKTTAGTVTVKVSGTVSYNGVSYTSATGTANVTVSALADVYFNFNGAAEGNPTMDYDSVASATKGSIVYKLEQTWKGNSTYNIKIYDGSDRFTTGSNITDNYPLSGSGYSLTTSGSNWVVLKTNTSISSSSTAKYTFYYDYTNKKLYVEYPHVVTFNSKGGSSVASQTITYGGKATKPTDPTKSGYDFDTWVTTDSGSTAFDFTNTAITSNTTIYAKWTAQTKTLNVNAKAKETSSGSYTATAPTSDITINSVKQTTLETAVGSSVTIAAPATDPDGYVFVGWYNGTTQVSTSRSFQYTMPTSETTLTARYDRKYTLTIQNKTNNGTLGATSKEVYYNDTPGNFTVTPNAGYQFDSANSTNLSTYYTAPSATSGTLEMTGKSSVAAASRVNTTITIAYKQITYPVQIAAFKMDDTATGYVPFSPATTAMPTVTGTTITNNTIPYSASSVTVTKNSTTPDGYAFVGWYYTTNVSSNVTSIPANHTLNNIAATQTFTPNGTAGSTYYRVIALYKKISYITLYNSYVKNADGSFTFVAAPPKKVEVGTGNTVRATYTYSSGTAAQRGEEQVKTSTGSYYEGNKLLVYPGETVKLIYSGLASSDMIKGAFYNNSLRYTTETESDNLYKQRVKYTGSGEDNWGDDGDDDWDYDYAVNTTLRAIPSYYTGNAKTAITNNESSYIATINQNTHTVSWTATGDYLNIDIELGTKYQLHINDDNWDGLKIENMNDEGYYYEGETFSNAFKVSLDNTTDTTGTYSWNGTTATIKDKDGAVISSGLTVTAKKSNGSNATNPSDVSYFLVSGNMPSSDVYVTLPIVKNYKMRLANLVVSDTVSNKTMITETDSDSATTGHIGTITAVPKKDNVTGSDISSDGTTYYTYDAHNNASHVVAYTSSTNNKKLMGGVNKNGSDVEAGSTVTYTFTFQSGKDAEYSFVGWYEGSLNENGYSFDVDYTKKLSGKPSFTYTPTKNTVVIAVATRDIYLGGNFTSAGAYTSTSANQTWTTGRIKMEFDPTYVNPDDNSKKGRYYYTFDTVTANTEYKFRAYDKVSGTSDTDSLNVWNTWNGNGYGEDNDDVLFAREKYTGGSVGGFMYKTNTNSATIANNTKTSTKSHLANGYAAPVTVYFYAYDGGISVSSTYQWSMAYVSEGRGIDATAVVSGATNSDGTTFNAPTATVNNKTVNNKDVVVTTEASKYGSGTRFEKIYECLVKEKDGQIVVNAKPNDVNVELQAFLVYNIETKASESVTTFTKSGTGADITYTGNITIPNNSKIYIVPIYKFTDTYISQNNLETHTVYVRAAEIDKNDWGGLVSMYSWGTDARYDSGRWPGQLMIPSDDGRSFYAPLTFQKNGLAGVTFNNYASVYGGKYTNFVGTYDDHGVSSVPYSSYTATGTHYIHQVFDYREPISIIDNINEKDPSIYDSEDMDMIFALKPGNKTDATIGNGAYNASFNYEYLTDSSGKFRVDLNGNKISTNPTATYYVVCNYTENYYGGTETYDFKEGSRDGTNTKNRYSIDWNVYDINGNKIDGSTKLSATYTDVYKSEMLTDIAKVLIEHDFPVSGKAVKIAYENPKISSSDNTEAKRYSGQWYADGVNTLVEGNVRVGIYSDGAWTPSDSNSPGYATATVSIANDFTPVDGEGTSTEPGCSGASVAKVTKTHATNGKVSFTVDTTNNFLGWYRSDGKGGYEPVGTNNKVQTITPSFNSDITYYAFYNASASYRFKYKGRNGEWMYYTAKGTDLTNEELANNGTLDPTARAADITSKLSKITDIKVFNHTLTYPLTDADTSSPYTITYTAGDTEDEYTLTVWSYNSSGTLVQKGSVTGTWSTALDVTKHASLGNGESLVTNKPSGHSNDVFIGWKKKGDSSNTILSTQANFGYSITQNTEIEPVFGSDRITAETWAAGIDKNVVTQELTNSTTGTIYNDTLVSFKYAKATGEQLDLGTNECGLIVVSQTGEAAANNSYNTAFDGINADNMKRYLSSLDSRNTDVAKLKAATYGEAYVQRIKVDSLSRLNRADLYQILDYSQFSGGQYKVMAYAKFGDTTVYSEPIVADYTFGQKFPTI